jgi:hypothetical protein
MSNEMTESDSETATIGATLRDIGRLIT